ncbi:DegV family protein [Dysosmobacter sp.]|uniref:DegV family protein n=1 Tax=Dysosmobacter sp. TaxID=2591382 RepID=UPI002A88ADD7|nr:DegV family protein [Dysosmobacter sp.]MDY3281142.1 DegV family protein [Dysosmobacter sp.]
MSEFTIITDSCCDLPAELAEELELEVLPLHLEMDGQDHQNRLVSRREGFGPFYDRLRQGVLATTSAVSAGEFEAVMRRCAQEGRDVLCLAFSSALSATYQSAVIAAETVAEDFPERKLRVVDTLCASLGQGLLVTLCARERLKGRTLEEVAAYAEETRLHICHWFTVDDLNHLKRGGRINAATALFGTMLSIKPVLHVDDEGRLVAVSKARGRKASIIALADKMAETVTDPAAVFISHGDCRADAELLAEEIRRRFPVRELMIHFVGPVIGNHSGPGTVALFFVGSRR